MSFAKRTEPSHRQARPATPLHAVVIGYGQFGRFHAAKYHTLENVALAGIVESSPNRRALAQHEYPDALIFGDVNELLDAYSPDIASIVVPATQHYQVARRLIDAGIHVLVEKPLASNVSHARTLMEVATENNVLVLPGHLERFNHTLTELRARVPAPRYLETRRLSCWSGRGDDVDVVMDLMIHDIDLIMNLVTSPILEIRAWGVKVISDHWDVVEAQLQFADGCIAKLTASRASPQTERCLRACSETTQACVDGSDGVMYQQHESGVSTSTCLCRHADPLAAQIADFVAAIRENRPPLVSAMDGCRAVKIAREITAAIKPDRHLPTRLAIAAPQTERLGADPAQ